MAENIQLAGLVVDLLLNTAAFEAGSRKAQRIANKAAKDIDKEFRSLQGALSGIFSRLGPIGEAASSALDQVGSAASAAMSKLGGLGSGIGTIGAVAAGTLTALATVSAAASAAIVSVAVHAAESAAKLEDLSHSTGVSVEALSKLQAVGHMIAPDVDIDTIAKGLERFGHATLNASTAAATAITPFQRMGIAVRDANGQVRPTEDLLTDVASKFASMSDGAIKTGFAMELFGKGGAALIPIFDEGGERFQHFIDLAEKFGAVINTETAEAAHKFKENISELGLALQGVENRVMEALLPALTAATKALDDLAEGTSYTDQKILDVTDGFGKFRTGVEGLTPIIHDLVEMTKMWIPILADMAITVGVAANELGGLIANLSTMLEYQSEIARHPIKFMLEGPMGIDAIRVKAEQTDESIRRANDDLIELGARLYAAVNAPATAKTPFDQLDEMEKRLKDFDKLHVNLKSNEAKQAELTIISQIQKLQAQADAEGMLAQAISEVSSATIEATAHAEALKTIAEMNAVAGKYGVSVTKEQAAAIEQATLRLEAYKAALKVNKDLQDNIDKTKIAAESTKELAAAYQQGGEAIEKAQEKAKLATLADAVNDLQELHDKLGKLPLSGKSAELFNTLGKSLQQAQAKLNAAAIAEHAQAMNDAALASAKLGDNLKFETEEMEKQIAATLQGTDALRAFNAQKQIDVFVQEHPGTLTADQIAGLRQQEASLGEAENELQVVQKFRSSENVKSIGDEIAELTKYHDVLVKDSTDELTYQAKMHDLLLSQQKAWDELLLKTNDTRAGVRVFFDEMAVDGETAAQRIHDSLTSTFNSLEDTFARFVEGQKVSWKELGNQILGTFAKQSIDQALRRGITALDTLFRGKLGGQQEAMNEKIPGGVGAPNSISSTIAALFGIKKNTFTPDGSQTNPLYVKLLNGFAGGPEVSSTTRKIDETLLSSLRLHAPPSELFSGLPGSLNEGFSPPTSTTASGLQIGGELASTFGSMIPGPAGAVASIAGQVAGTIGGAMKSSQASGPPSGTQGNPFHVIVDNQLPAAGIPGAPNIGNIGLDMGPMSSISGLLQGAEAPSGAGSGLSDAFSSIESTASSFLNMLPFGAAEGGHVSGPGTSTSDSIPAMLSAGEYVINAKAVQRVGKNHLDAINSGQPLRHFVAGGDVTPGKAYIVGERRPELFMPRSAGRIFSSVPARESGADSSMVVNQHFHGVQDVDTFKRSKSQMAGWVQEQMYVARRNK